MNSYQANIKKLNRLLPFVAIGTVADCQSIVDSTNRLLVKAGLQILNGQSHTLKGLSDLLNITGLNSKIKQGYKLNSQDLGYTLSPILNSSGRLSHASLSISCLLANDSTDNYFAGQVQFQGDSLQLATDLVQTNSERKIYVKELIFELEQIVKIQLQNQKILIWLETNDVSKGVIGLIASRFVNEYYLPVIIISTQNCLNQDEVSQLYELFKKEKNTQLLVSNSEI
jgi:single-stranded-DNA-specific exonuclease